MHFLFKAKAKLLLRELRTVKVDLGVQKSEIIQLSWGTMPLMKWQQGERHGTSMSCKNDSYKYAFP